jgi:hypothetical protein
MDILYGQTPDITMKVHDLPSAQTECTVDKSGTLAQPVFDIGIPRSRWVDDAAQSAVQAQSAASSAASSAQTVQMAASSAQAAQKNASSSETAAAASASSAASSAQTAEKAAQDVLRSEAGAHAKNKDNPHEVTAEQVGLGNVPNVTTDDQTPSFDATLYSDIQPSSGEKLSVTLGKLAQGATQFVKHTKATNPHGVTAAQVGLGNVNNTSDADKPVSTAQKAAIEAVQTVATTASTDATKALGIAARPNLLDNSNFLNPVNQRGVSGTITTAGYFIDRWKLVSGSVTISSSGLKLTAGTQIAQITENKPTGTVNQRWYGSGYATQNYDFDTKTYTFTATQDCTVTAIKIESGSGATPWYDKGYAEELAKCQRYYQKYNVARSMGVHRLQNVVFRMALPVTMRTTPTIVGVSAVNVIYNSTIHTASPSAATIEAKPGGLLCTLPVPTLTGDLQICSVFDDCIFELSADL